MAIVAVTISLTTITVAGQTTTPRPGGDNPASTPGCRLSLESRKIGADHATITGSIEVDRGGPLPSVTLLLCNLADGTVATSGFEQHRDRRTFTVRLPPGDYRFWGLLAYPNFLYTVASLTEGDVNLLADPLRVAAGQRKHLALRLHTARPLVAVSGRVVLLDPAASMPGTLSIVAHHEHDSVVLRASVQPDGSFEFPAVPPDTYTASLSGQGFDHHGTRVVVDTPRTGLEIVLPARRELRGRVIVDGGRSVPANMKAIVSPCPPGNNGPCVMMALPVGTDGTFTLMLEDGHYEIELRGLPPGYLASINVGKSNEKSFTLGPGTSDVVVSLSPPRP
jgi:hypothetical protein